MRKETKKYGCVKMLLLLGTVCVLTACEEGSSFSQILRPDDDISLSMMEVLTVPETEEVTGEETEEATVTFPAWQNTEATETVPSTENLMHLPLVWDENGRVVEGAVPPIDMHEHIGIDHLTLYGVDDTLAEILDGCEAEVTEELRRVLEMCGMYGWPTEAYVDSYDTTKWTDQVRLSFCVKGYPKYRVVMAFVYDTHQIKVYAPAHKATEEELARYYEMFGEE